MAKLTKKQIEETEAYLNSPIVPVPPRLAAQARVLGEMLLTMAAQPALPAPDLDRLKKALAAVAASHRALWIDFLEIQFNFVPKVRERGATDVQIVRMILDGLKGCSFYVPSQFAQATDVQIKAARAALVPHTTRGQPRTDYTRVVIFASAFGVTLPPRPRPTRAK